MKGSCFYVACPRFTKKVNMTLRPILMKKFVAKKYYQNLLKLLELSQTVVYECF